MVSDVEDTGSSLIGVKPGRQLDRGSGLSMTVTQLTTFLRPRGEPTNGTCRKNVSSSYKAAQSSQKAGTFTLPLARRDGSRLALLESGVAVTTLLLPLSRLQLCFILLP